MKYQVVQKMISEKEYIQQLQAVVARKACLYRKKGMSQAEALNKAFQKLYKRKINFSDNLACSSGTPYDPEVYAKLRKQSGLSLEEYNKTVLLKKEIDSLFDQKINQECSNSSEECSSNDNHHESSPQTKEKLRAEKKCKKNFQKVIETLMERVEHQSSSGSCSGDEKFKQAGSKKRKFHDYLSSQKAQQEGSNQVYSPTQISADQPYRIQLQQVKRRHLNEVSSGQQQQNSHKKRTVKDFLR